jgi:hypothetical protein
MSAIQNNAKVSPRFQSLAQLKPGLFAGYFDPLPSDFSLRQFLLRHRVPFIKTNPVAKRGGGACFYSVAATEKALRSSAGVWTAPRRRVVSQQERGES